MKKFILSLLLIIGLSVPAEAVVVTGGNIGGYEFFVSPTITIQNAAYVLGNCIGGIITVPVAITTGVTGLINKFTFISNAGSTVTKQIYVFTSNPSSSTCTDKSTFTIAAADRPKLITSFPVTPVVPTGVTFSVAEVSGLTLPFTTSGNANIYLMISEGGSETPAATNDYILNIMGVKEAQ